MKSKPKIKQCFIVMCVTTGCLAVTNPPISKMAVKVVDESGLAVSKAQVHAWTYWKTDGKIIGNTDMNGLFEYEDRVYREIGYSVQKEGYYASLGTAWRPKTRYQVPDTNLVVVLRRISDPVPMIRRSIRTNMPTTHEEVSFDLSVGDWTAPHGKGEFPDISFASSLQFETRSNFKVEVFASFSEPFGGVLRFCRPKRADSSVLSELMPPHSAPTNGYEKTLSLWRSNNPNERGKNHEKPDNNYIFRTRVVTNGVGEIVSANYAWTIGEVRVDTTDGKRPWIGFTYYFNPDPHSRSLEPKELADRQARDIPSIE